MARTVLVLTVLATLACGPGARQGQEGNAAAAAGLAVFHGDGSQKLVLTSFSGDEISGVALIEQSGVPFVSTYNASLNSVAVCRLDNEGCGDPERCFCDSGRYWSVWRADGSGVWSKSETGVSAIVLKDGDIMGMVWGDGETAPPPVSWEQFKAPR